MVTDETCRRKEGKGRIKMFPGFEIILQRVIVPLTEMMESGRDAGLVEEEAEFDFLNIMLEGYIGYQIKMSQGH